jgi:cytidylate kinase
MTKTSPTSSAPGPPHVVIAIDGPAASGKSSVARELARRLDFVYLNSGAIYRAITWHLLDQGIGPADEAAVAEAAGRARIQCDLSHNDSRVLINHIDPTSHLRDGAVNQAVSAVSANPAVREVANREMHDCAQARDLVVEGRDIGSVVFPETPYQFYIDATPEVRARRRAAEGLLDQISARDRADTGRAAAPLMIAPDAEVIDTSEMSIAEVADEIERRLRAKNFAARRPAA